MQGLVTMMRQRRYLLSTSFAVACHGADPVAAGSSSSTTDDPSSTSGSPEEEPPEAGGPAWARGFHDEPLQVVPLGASDSFVLGRCTSQGFGGDPLPGPTWHICLARLGPQGRTVWSQDFVSDGTEHGGMALAVDASGRSVVASAFGGSIDLGGGPLLAEGETSVFLAGFEADGSHRWSRRLICDPGNSCPVSMGSLAVDASGHIFMSGTTHGLGATIDLGGGMVPGGIWLASFDDDGNHRWSRGFAISPSFAGALLAQGSSAVDADGNLYVAANVSGFVDLGGGPLGPGDDWGQAGVIASFDAHGNHRWSRRLHLVGQPSILGQEVVSVEAIAIDAHGTAHVTGWFIGSVDFGGGALTSVGSIDGPGTEMLRYQDTFVASFTRDGEYRWARRFGDDVQDEGRAIATDRVGNVVLAGAIVGRSWTEDPLGGAVDFGGGPLEGRGIYVVGLTADGAHRWSTWIGNDSEARPRVIATDQDGRTYLSGFGAGQLDLGFASVDADSGFLAKLER